MGFTFIGRFAWKLAEYTVLLSYCSAHRNPPEECRPKELLTDPYLQF